MRKTTMFVVVVLGLLGKTASGQEPNKLPPADKVAEYLQAISVTIKAGGAEGSGTIKMRVIDGKPVSFIWTAAHVVDGLRTTKEIIDPKTGTKRTVVSFKDAEIVREAVEDGRRVGESKMDASVIRFSEEQDLCLLRVLKRDFAKESVVFYLDPPIPPVGRDLYHVGSLLGQMGSNSLTPGIVSQIGRTLDKREYDQTTCTAFPGSSGGGVYLRDGRYVGMITRGAGEGFNLMVPVRRLHRWAKAAGIEWAVDDKVKPPTEAELAKVPAEDTGVSFGSGSKPEEPEPSSLREYPYLIIRRVLGDESILRPTPAPPRPQPQTAPDSEWDERDVPKPGRPAAC